MSQIPPDPLPPPRPDRPAGRVVRRFRLGLERLEDRAVPVATPKGPAAIGLAPAHDVGPTAAGRAESTIVGPISAPDLATRLAAPAVAAPTSPAPPTRPAARGAAAAVTADRASGPARVAAHPVTAAAVRTRSPARVVDAVRRASPAPGRRIVIGPARGPLALRARTTAIALFATPRTRAAVGTDARYQVTSRRMTWDQAEAEARALGGHLATVSDADEQAWLRSTFGPDVALWIGLNDATVEGRFAWADGTGSDFNAFAPGSAGNAPAADHVALNAGPAGTWAALPGGVALWGVIEIPTPHPAPTPPPPVPIPPATPDPTPPAPTAPDPTPAAPDEPAPPEPAGRPAPTPPGLALAVGELTVDEGAGSVEIPIVRTGDLSGPSTVAYRTVDLSAWAGADYAAMEGVAAFGPGEVSRTVAIRLIDDSEAEGPERLALVIDDPTGATLRSPRTATLTLRDDESPVSRLLAFSRFDDATALWLNQGAALAGGVLLLAPPIGGEAGSAYARSPIAIDAATRFSTRFAFNPGGDGRLAFVLQDGPEAEGAVGAPDAGLGLAGLGRSLAVAFDANAGTVAVYADGDLAAPLGVAPLPFALEAGTTAVAWVDHDPVAGRLSVSVAPTAERPERPTLDVPVDLAARVGTRAFVGFAAATGASAQRVPVVSGWDLDTNAVPLPAPAARSPFLAETPWSGLILPLAIDWSTDGRNLYVAEKAGAIRVIRDGVLLPHEALNIGAQVNESSDRGLLDIAVHPDLTQHPYLYLSYTYDPPETAARLGDPLAGPDGAGNRGARITRVTLDAATGYTTAVPGSEVVLVGKNSVWSHYDGTVDSTTDFGAPPAGIGADGSDLNDFVASDSASHSAGGLEFGPDGMLYATIGDGTSYNRVDPRSSRVQDVNNLSGKVLRIDPITGQGPPDNPFFDGDPDANRSKVYQLGLRNAFRFSVDRATGTLYLGDVGWTAWDELNTGPPGANFGWPWYEGGDGRSLRTVGYQDLAAAVDFYASGTPVVAPALGLAHADGINTIVVSDVYRGGSYPETYDGVLLYNDFFRGIVRALKLGPDGQVAAIEPFATGASGVVQMKVGPDGLMYFVDLIHGTVGRWVVG